MIRILDAGDPEVFRRRGAPGPDMDAIRSIVNDVRERGDAAVAEHDERFGGKADPMRLESEDIRRAYRRTDRGVLDAVRGMAARLGEAERPLLEAINSAGGTRGVTRTFTPIPSVGCYVPGGRARYPSSCVMSVVPASVAGVGRIAVASPPSGGAPDAATVAAADLCGAHEIYATGGAQAVAALAYGTESIRRVDRIVGPGGAAVTAAKRLVSPDVSVDMQAGPTELGIMADRGADPDLISLDMISQAEHGADTVCFLLTDSGDTARAVAQNIEERLPRIRRADTVRESLHRNGFAAVCDGMRQMRTLAERLAPEHLQVMTANPRADAAGIGTPGLVLLGGTPSAASDYLLGSNHILPTGGQGRVRGQLSVLDFVKMRTQVEATTDDLRDIVPRMREITRAEGLPNHLEAVLGRMK